MGIFTVWKMMLLLLLVRGHFEIIKALWGGDKCCFVHASFTVVVVFLPVPNPAGVAVRALAMNGVAVVAVFTGGTHLLAVLAKEALGAELVAPGPVPAPVAGDAASLCHLTGLLALAVPAPVFSQTQQRK